MLGLPEVRGFFLSTPVIVGTGNKWDKEGRWGSSGTEKSVQRDTSWAATTSAAPAKFHEIILSGEISFVPIAEKSIRYSNFYPTLGIIATGESYAQLPTHNTMHRGFVAWARAQSGFEVTVPDGGPIQLFKLGKDVVMCLDSHAEIWAKLSKDLSPQSQAQAGQLVLAYVNTANEQRSEISPQGGKVVALGDSEAEIEFFAQIFATSISAYTTIFFSRTDDLTPIVNAYADGKDYIIRLESLVESNLANIEELLAHYETAIQMATARVTQTGGRLILAADSGSQKLIAKLLGRLHQVENGAEVGHTGAEFIRRAIQESAAGCHLKNLSSGTRYFFAEDLGKLVQMAELPEVDSLDQEDRAGEIEKHRSSLLASITELTHFLTNKNKHGNPEGQIFLVRPDNQQLVTDKQEQKIWAERFADIRDSIEASKVDWQNEYTRIKEELSTVVQQLRAACHPGFHKIDLNSPVFVRLVNRALRNDSNTLNLGEEVSTPLIALEVGFFDPHRRGGKTFIPTTNHPIVQDVGDWLITQEAAKLLGAAGAKLLPLDADYIVAYRPARPITQEFHPTKFIDRFGHTEPKEAFVLEWGTATGTRERWVIDSNVWSPAELKKRAERIRDNSSNRGKGAGSGETLLELLEPSASDPNKIAWSAREISGHIADFKRSQHRLFNAILSAMPETKVKLAPPYSLASIQEGPTSDDFRIRPYVDGRRLDLMRFTEWDVTRLERVLEMEADLMAAGIIAQLPHLPQHDIIISAERQGRTISGLTYLSPGESFCHSSSRNHEHYLDKIVPGLCGNAIARLVAQIGYASNSPTVQQDQGRLIKLCVGRIKQRLKELRDTRGGAESRRAKILMEFEHAASSTDDGNSNRSPILQIGRFVPTSVKLLNMTDHQLNGVIKQINLFARAELALIRGIAPATENNEDAATCATAISSLIGRHVSEGNKSRQVIKGLVNLRHDLHELSIIERAWYITLLDVHMRMDELDRKRELGTSIKEAFVKSEDANQFYNELTETAGELDITFETTTALHQALKGLAEAWQSVECSDAKRKLLAKILRKWSIFKDIIQT